jgi:hypothetical protein
VNFGGYKSALFLVAIVALIEAIFSFYFTPGNLSLVGVTLVFLFGLWVQNKAARYLGAVWFLVLAGLMVWPLFTTGTVIFSPGLILLFIWAALCLVVAYILVFSKTFAAEFLHERETQPKYKRNLAKAFIIIVILIVVILTLNDIYHLFLA